jgi:hypothetical protein
VAAVTAVAVAATVAEAVMAAAATRTTGH